MKFDLGAIPSLLREINERKVVDLLRAEGPLHAAEISRLAGISKPTISAILRSLVDCGLISEFLPGEKDSRRAKTMFQAQADLKVCLAIEIGSRFIRAAISDLNGVIRSEASLTNYATSLFELLRIVEDATKQVLEASNFETSDISSIAVGIPGVINQENDKIEIAGTVSLLEGVNLSQKIERMFSIKPIIVNDVNLLTLAEQVAGHGRGISNFSVISIDAGLGAGLVLNGKLHLGHNGAAGEIFYIPFGHSQEGENRTTNPSGDRIGELTRSLVGNFPETTLNEPYATTDILQAAQKGDPLGKAVFELEASRIALYIAGIAAVVDVEIVVLAGAIGSQAKFIQNRIEGLLKEFLPYPPELRISELIDIGILLGALELATTEACDQVFKARYDQNAKITSQVKSYRS
jgi:predicted NBD/HSP70 family sugar kinase